MEIMGATRVGSRTYRMEDGRRKHSNKMSANVERKVMMLYKLIASGVTSKTDIIRAMGISYGEMEGVVKSASLFEGATLYEYMSNGRVSYGLLGRLYE